MDVRRVLPLLLLTCATGCVSHAPRLQLPTNVEADCENRAVKQTAVDAIIASTDDTPQMAATYPGDAALRKIVKTVGGGFAYWKPPQPLRLPDTAKALGVSGDYLDLTRAVVTNEINKEDHWRPIWLTFRTPSGERTVLERAYDIQNVCIEGQRDI